MIATHEVAGLVDAGWIAGHLDDPGVRIVEVDVSPANYNQGHIPGAVLWNAYSDLRQGDYRPVPRADLEALLARSGIDAATTVVFYGYGALLGFWLLEAYGHSAVRMFNGSREDWVNAGETWSGEPASYHPTATTGLRPGTPTDLAERADVEAAMTDPGTVLLDVRSTEEYSGERFWPSGASADVGRAGHIPNAVSVPIDLVRNASGAVRDAEELRRLYTGAGIVPGKKVIVYCTIGNRAALSWFILTHLLDYPDVAVYYGSFVEWGKLPDTPIDTG